MSDPAKDSRVPAPNQPADPNADAVTDLDVSADQVRGGSKWELSELDAVRPLAPKPDVQSIGTKYTT